MVNPLQEQVEELLKNQAELEMQNKELRQALLEQSVAHASFMELYDFAPVAYLTIDSSGRITETNLTAATLLGVDRKKLIGRVFADMVHRDALKAWNNHRRHTSGHREKHGTDLTLRRPNGAVFTARVECTSRTESNECLMVLMDISDRIKAEEALRQNEQAFAQLNVELEQRIEKRSVALRESEERFRTLFEEAPDPLFLLSLTGKIIDGNKAGEQLSGYRREELIGKNIFKIKLLSPLSFKNAIRNLAALAKNHRIPPEEVCFYHKDGREIWMESSAIPIRLQEKTVVLGSARDLTARKQTEEALRESEERYRLIFESESDAILIFDGETRQFVDANKAAEKLYEYTHDEFLQLTYTEITAEPEIPDATIRNVQTQNPAFIPCRMHRRKDGIIFPVEITACTFRLKGRQTICAVTRDITERIAHVTELSRNREELRHLASELSMAEQRERQRIAAELHDGLSQLLSSASLRLDMAKNAGLPEDTTLAMDAVRDILKQSLHHTRTLTFELSCPMLNELGLAAALEELCISMSKEQTVRFEFDGCTQPLSLTQDCQQILYRSTRELLINVTKHSDAHRAHVTLAQENGQVTICVEDDGKGFDAATAGKGFSPSGGFGLFNIREYLHHAGGVLRADSIPDDGTRITLTLPLEEENE